MRLLLLIGLAAGLLAAATGDECPALDPVTDQRVNYLSNPLAIDPAATTLHFTWTLPVTAPEPASIRVVLNTSLHDSGWIATTTPWLYTATLASPLPPLAELEWTVSYAVNSGHSADSDARVGAAAITATARSAPPCTSPAAVAVLETAPNSTFFRQMAQPIRVPPPAPPPAAATRLQLVYTDAFVPGTYNESLARNVTTESACVAQCNASPLCVALTFVERTTLPPCVLYSALDYGAALVDYAGVSNWIKLPGRFIHAPSSPACPEPSLPDGCIFWEEFAAAAGVGRKHFVSDCDQFPAACSPALQRPCWGQAFAPLAAVSAAYLRSLPYSLRDNYTCTMDPLSGVGAGRHPAQLLRHVFNVPSSGSKLTRARVYLGGVGWMEAEINGEPLTGQGGPDTANKLNPGRADLEVRQLFDAYVVPPFALRIGQPNCVGVLLGHGWQTMEQHRAVVRLLLLVEFADGTRKLVGSQAAGWNGTATGPIFDADVYLGESYNAALEMPGWSGAGFAEDPTRWQPVVVDDEFAGDGYVLAPAPMPPIRALQRQQPLTLQAVNISASELPVFVFDFGQNTAGWAELLVPEQCPAGTVITMYPAEVLCGHGPTTWSPPCAPGQVPGNGVFGSVDQRDLRGNWRDIYICAGNNTESFTWAPRFTYRGFRFVELHGYPRVPTFSTLTQRFVHSDIESLNNDSRSSGESSHSKGGSSSDLPRRPAGAIECRAGSGCQLFNAIAHNVRWTLSDNVHSVPEDCDQRNERLGWMADGAVSAEAAHYFHGVNAFYEYWLQTMADVQMDPRHVCQAAVGVDGDTNVDPVSGQPNCTGAMPNKSPNTTPAPVPGDPSWMVAFPLVYLYQGMYGGNVAFLQRLYPNLVLYTEFLLRMAERSRTGLISFHDFGDWLQPGRVASTDYIGAMSSAFNYVQSLDIAARASLSLGEASAAGRYAALASAARGLFRDRYFHAQNQTWGDNTQAALVYALMLNASDSTAARAQALQQLVALIHSRTDQCAQPPCLATGIITTKWLMEVLAAEGQHRLAVDLLLKQDYPSWGFMVGLNATTVWEHWEWMAGSGMNSHNHPALASVGAYLFRWLLGARTRPSDFARGWQVLVFGPPLVDDPRMTSLRGHVATGAGEARLGWALAEGGQRLWANVSAPVALPVDFVLPPWAAPASATVTSVPCGGAWRRRAVRAAAACRVWADGAFVQGGCPAFASGEASSTEPGGGGQPQILLHAVGGGDICLEVVL